MLANEVTARNDLDNAVEELRQVTGNYYPELASLNVNGFKTNKPQAVNALLKEAENRNLSLLQARLNQDPAREQISPGAGRPFADAQPIRVEWDIEYQLQWFKNP